MLKPLSIIVDTAQKVTYWKKYKVTLNLNILNSAKFSKCYKLKWQRELKMKSETSQNDFSHPTSKSLADF